MFLLGERPPAANASAKQSNQNSPQWAALPTLPCLGPGTSIQWTAQPISPQHGLSLLLKTIQALGIKYQRGRGMWERYPLSSREREKGWR